MTIDPSTLFGRKIDDVLNEFKPRSTVISYSKVGDSEFINFEDDGFFVSSAYDESVISNIVVYLQHHENYLQSAQDARKCFNFAKTYKEFEKFFGKHTRDIPSIKIPGRPVKPSGRTYVSDVYQFNVSSYDSENVAYVGISKA